MTYKHYQNAKAEGRLCSRCGWFISKKRWKAGKRLCEGCEDALKGVSGPEAENRSGPYQDDTRDITGNAI